jgi:hypothetical protein
MMDYFKQISPVSSISIQWSDQPRHPICLQVLYGAQSDHPWSRSDLLVRPIPSFLPLFSLSLSQGERYLPCGEAPPFDPRPTEGIPSLTATSSTISSGYFINSFHLYPWISLVRVPYVKHEDSILDLGFVGLMIGIEL